MIAPLLISQLRHISFKIGHISFGLLKTSPSNRYYYSQIQAPDIANYQQYLDKHNKSIKNPHPRLQMEQQKIVTKYIDARNYGPIIDFIAYNANKILCHDKTVEKIDESLIKDWAILNPIEKTTAAYALICHGERRVFELFKSQILEKIKKEGLQSLSGKELLTYLNGQLITHKSISFISQLFSENQTTLSESSIPPTPLNQRNKLEIIFNQLIEVESANLSYYEKTTLQHLIKYFSLLIDPSQNKMEESNPTELLYKRHSRLQAHVESLLESMQIDRKREVIINGFNVDFAVYKANKLEKQNPKPFCILEINGNYHYNLQGKLKGLQVIRNLIVNEYAPLRIVHHIDYLRSKGHRNKIAHIQELLESDHLNWEMLGKGTNNKWQVQVDDQLMKEFA